MSASPSRPTTRRIFLQQGLLAGGMLALPRISRAASSPHEQVNLGIIGLGWRGGQLLEVFSKLPSAKIVAICDPDQSLIDQWAPKAPGAETFRDLRKLLEVKDLDAVVVATCNHWHCLAAQWAMEAGKHVYVEKPLANALWEGRQVVECARKHNLVCQIGTQQRSSPMQAEIKKVLHEDKTLGKIQWVRVNRYGVRASIGKRDTPLEIPPTIAYNLWLGPAQDRPIYRDKLHYDWHWDWNTGAGEMGNWGVHIMDDVRNNVFRDEVPFPQRIAAAGGRFAWHDAGDTPNVHFAIFDTGEIPVVMGLTNLPAGPNKKKSPLCPGPDTGYIVHCEGGRLEGQRGSFEVLDESGKSIKKTRGLEGMQIHQQNFLDAIRAGAPDSLNGPVEEGHYSSAWCTMANYAYRVAHQVGTQPADLRQTFTDFSHGTDLAPTAAEMLDSLAQLATSFDGSQANVNLGPVLHFDGTQEVFIGEHAAEANKYVQVDGRGVFEVKSA